MHALSIRNGNPERKWIAINHMPAYRNFSCRNMLCTYLHSNAAVCAYEEKTWGMLVPSLFYYIFIFVMLKPTSPIKFPNVSRNRNYCIQEFLGQTVHHCQCETYDQDFIEKKNSYIKFHVSTYVKVLTALLTRLNL